MKQQNKQAPVALITGAARRIGAVIAKTLHQAGYRIVIHYHQSQCAAEALITQLNQIGQNSAIAFSGDLSQPQVPPELIQKTLTHFGQLDLLVNNASLFEKTIRDHDNHDTWDKLFNLNVKAPWLLSMAAKPHLIVQQGSIINLTDIHAKKPLKEYAVYCQTKAALTMQTQALAREFAPHVRVNAIAPGAIMWPEGTNALTQAEQTKIITNTPLKQHGDAIYIAEALLALATNPFITGQVLAVDGGRSIL